MRPRLDSNIRMPDSLLENDPWRFTRRFIGITALAASLVQLIVSPDALTLECLGLCLVGVLLLALQFQRTKFRKNPFSMLMLLGLGSTYFYLPLIFTTFEFNPLHNRLVAPLEDFGMALIVYACLILMQRFCAGFSPVRSLRRRISTGVLKPLGFFSTPAELQLWGMGLIGVLSFLVVAGGNRDEEAGVLVKFFQAFRIFTFAPYLLLVPQMIGETGRIKKSATVLIVFTAVLFCLAMATGSRSYTVVGLVTAACSYWLGVWAGVIRATRIKFRHVALVGIGLFLITGPLEVAFTAAKAGGGPGNTANRSISESFSDFVEAVSSDDILDSYRNRTEKAAEQEGAWVEAYVDNEFLRRFANLSFLDNTLSIVLTFDDNTRKKTANLEYLRMMSILPDPVIKVLGLDVNKKEDLRGSMGDLFYNETQSADTGLGSFKTGSLIASTYNLFGWGFPVIISLVGGALFIFMDSLVVPEASAPNSGAEERKLKFSTLGVLQSYAIFSIFSSATSVESFSGLLSILVRSFPQWVLLYAITFWATRFVFRASTTVLKGKEMPAARGPMKI